MDGVSEVYDLYVWFIVVEWLVIFVYVWVENFVVWLWIFVDLMVVVGDLGIWYVIF